MAVDHYGFRDLVTKHPLSSLLSPESPLEQRLLESVLLVILLSASTRNVWFLSFFFFFGIRIV